MKKLKKLESYRIDRSMMKLTNGGLQDSGYTCFVEGEWVGHYSGASLEEIIAHLKTLYGGDDIYCRTPD